MTKRYVHAAALAAVVAVLVVPATARAQYLDPGSGSILVQALIAGFVAAAAGLKLYWGRISSLVSRKRKGDASN